MDFKCPFLKLDAAKELFADQGLGVTMHTIAVHAGVGVGTIYRHFPEKRELIDLLFEEQLRTKAATGSWRPFLPW